MINLKIFTFLESSFYFYPSYFYIYTITTTHENLPIISVCIDCCFISNPYPFSIQPVHFTFDR